MSTPIAVLLPRRRPPVIADADPWQWWSAETIAAVSQCPVEAVRANWPLVDQALRERGIHDRRVCAGAIGTIAIETASTFAPVREAYWLSESWRRANLSYYPWYGRGFVQTTWQSNYARVQEVLGILCLTDPDLLLEPWPSARALALYFDERGVAAAALADDWEQVRYRVLGGYDGLARLTRIATTLLETTR